MTRRRPTLPAAVGQPGLERLPVVHRQRQAEEPCTPSWGTFYTLGGGRAGRSTSTPAPPSCAARAAASMSPSAARPTPSWRSTAPTRRKLAAGLPGTDPALPRERDRPRHRGRERSPTPPPTPAARRRSPRCRRQLAREDKPLRVWMTLPVSSTGLTAEGIAAVQAMLKADVEARRRQRDGDGLRPRRRRRAGHDRDDRERADGDPAARCSRCGAPPA